MFKLNNDMLEIMTEDPKVRLWGKQKNQLEHYMKLKQLLTVDYEYLIIGNMDHALETSRVWW